MFNLHTQHSIFSWVRLTIGLSFDTWRRHPSCLWATRRYPERPDPETVLEQLAVLNVYNRIGWPRSLIKVLPFSWSPPSTEYRSLQKLVDLQTGRRNSRRFLWEACHVEVPAQHFSKQMSVAPRYDILEWKVHTCARRKMFFERRGAWTGCVAWLRCIWSTIAMSEATRPRRPFSSALQLFGRCVRD